jgi:hypothetical protein
MGLLLAWAGALHAADQYALTEDSIPKPGAPRGEVRGSFQWRSANLPGTNRQYRIYVPVMKTIGIFINPGVVPAPREGAEARYFDDPIKPPHPGL